MYISGVYDVETGEKVLNGTEFRFIAGTTVQRHRSYHFYNTSGDNVTVHQRMARPFVMLASKLPPLENLTKKLNTVQPGADVTANNTANDTSNVNGLPSANVSGWAHPTDRTTIHGGKIYTGSITAQQIAAGTITAAEIAAGSITAESGVVGSLDADKITTGTLSAGSVKVSSNDGKTYFLGDTFFVYDASNQLRVKIGRLS
jgi:hypothetical protein